MSESHRQGDARMFRHARAVSARVFGPIVLIGCVAAAFGAVVTSAGAAKPTEVTILTSAPCGLPVASFEASGGIAGSGTATFVVTSPTAGRFGLTGTTLHGTGTFEGTTGSFALRWNMVIKDTADPNVFTETGTWHLTSGNVKGEGRFSGTCTAGGTDDLRWDGRVQ